MNSYIVRTYQGVNKYIASKNITVISKWLTDPKRRVVVIDNNIRTQERQKRNNNKNTLGRPTSKRINFCLSLSKFVHVMYRDVPPFRTGYWDTSEHIILITVMSHEWLFNSYIQLTTKGIHIIGRSWKQPTGGLTPQIASDATRVPISGPLFTNMV